MSASFVLELDTAAPEVVFGSFNPPVVGSLFTIPVSFDEPGIIAASLQDSNGVLWPMAIFADRIEAVVDEQASEGSGKVFVLARDSTLNETTYEATVSIAGEAIAYIHRDPPLTGTVFASSVSGVVAPLAARGIVLGAQATGELLGLRTSGEVLVYRSTGSIVPVETGGTLL